MEERKEESGIKKEGRKEKQRAEAFLGTVVSLFQVHPSLLLGALKLSRNGLCLAKERNNHPPPLINTCISTYNRTRK